VSIEPIDWGSMLTLLAQSGRDRFEWHVEDTVTAVAIVVFAIVVTLVSRAFVHRLERRLSGSQSLTQETNLQRATTLSHAVSTAVVLVIWAIAILVLLENVGLDLGPLLVSAGVAGVALGFGAQSVVRDSLSGFFILLENQFGVGDILDVQTSAGLVGGKVEELTFRITTLRAFDGTLNVVPNGNIVFVSNKSRGWARAIVDVRVAYGEDLERVRSILDGVFEEVHMDPEMRDWIMAGPSILGVESPSEYAQILRVVAETRPSKRWDTERRLRERISAALAKNGVQVPLPPAVRQGSPQDR
jgi:moderate conductance mechanosensitive channel